MVLHALFISGTVDGGDVTYMTHIDPNLSVFPQQLDTGCPASGRGS